MDPLTHTVVGASLGRTGVARRTRGGMAALVIGANVPDIDVFTYFWGSDAALAHRRGWTHGPIGLIGLSVLTAVLIVLWYRYRGKGDARFGSVLALTLVGALSHPLLDWLNTYGVRWLYPFDKNWFYGDALVVVDPWLWLLLGVPFLLTSEPGPWIKRGLLLFSSIAATVIGWRAPSYLPLIAGIVLLLFLAMRAPTPKWRYASALGLVLGGAWIAALLASQAVAEHRVERQLTDLGPERMMVGPAPARPWLWDVTVEAADQYRWGRYDLWKDSLDLDPKSYPLPASNPELVEAASRADHIRGYMNWARFPVYRQSDSGDQLLIYDLRYVRDPTAGFGVVEVDLP